MKIKSFTQFVNEGAVDFSNVNSRKIEGLVQSISNTKIDVDVSPDEIRIDIMGISYYIYPEYLDEISLQDIQDSKKIVKDYFRGNIEKSSILDVENSLFAEETYNGWDIDSFADMMFNKYEEDLTEKELDKVYDHIATYMLAKAEIVLSSK